MYCIPSIAETGCLWRRRNICKPGRPWHPQNLCVISKFKLIYCQIINSQQWKYEACQTFSVRHWPNLERLTPINRREGIRDVYAGRTWERHVPSIRRDRSRYKVGKEADDITQNGTAANDTLKPQRRLAGYVTDTWFLLSRFIGRLLRFIRSFGRYRLFSRVTGTYYKPLQA